jgi:outer membrane protein TolC
MTWLTLFLLAQSPRALTLPQALDLAHSSQPVLVAARERLSASRLEVVATERAWLPTVGVGAGLVAATANNSTAVVLSSGALDLPRIGGTKTLVTPSWAPTASTLLGVTVRQELYDFGRLSLATAVAKAGADVEQARAAAVGAEVDAQVADAFVSVQSARAVEQAIAAALTRARLNRDFAVRAVAAGLKAPVELTRSEAELARAEVASVRANESLQLARSALAAAIGLAAPEVEAVGELEDPAVPPDRAGLQHAVLEREPTLRALRAQSTVQQAQVELSSAQLRPNLALSATLSGRAGGTPPSSGESTFGGGWLPAVPNYDVGAVLSWPLLDLAQNTRTDAQRARAAAAGHDVSALEERLTHLVDQLWTRLQQARAAQTALDAALRAANANLEQAQARFELGLGTSVELADAQNLKTDAEVQVVLGRATARAARIALDRLTQEYP